MGNVELFLGAVGLGTCSAGVGAYVVRCGIFCLFNGTSDGDVCIGTMDGGSVSFGQGTIAIAQGLGSNVDWVTL